MAYIPRAALQVLANRVNRGTVSYDTLDDGWKQQLDTIGYTPPAPKQAEPAPSAAPVGMPEDFDPEMSDPSLRWKAEQYVPPTPQPEFYSPEGGYIAPASGGEPLWQQGDAAKVAFQALKVPYNLGFGGGPETDVFTEPTPAFTKQDMQQYQESMAPVSPLGKGLGWGAEQAALLPFYATAELAAGAPLAAAAGKGLSWLGELFPKLTPAIEKAAPYVKTFASGFGSGAPVGAMEAYGAGESLPDVAKAGLTSGLTFGGFNVGLKGAGSLIKGGLNRAAGLPGIEAPGFGKQAASPAASITETDLARSINEIPAYVNPEVYQGIQSMQRPAYVNPQVWDSLNRPVGAGNAGQPLIQGMPKAELPGMPTIVPKVSAEVMPTGGIPRPATTTGPAIWRNNGIDTPVTVTGEAGRDKLGRQYVNVEESNTAVPLDEIRQIAMPEGVGAMSNRYDTTQSIKSAKDLKEPFSLGTLVDKANKAYVKAVDSIRTLDKVDKYLKKTTGETIPADKDLYTNATNTTSAPGMAARTMEENMVDFEGNAVAPSLKSVIDMVSKAVGGDKNWGIAEDYLKLKHSPSWMSKGRNVYPPESGLDAPVKQIKDALAKMELKSTTDAERVMLQAEVDRVASGIKTRFNDPRMAAHEQQHPEIAQVTKIYTDWISKFYDEWIVKTGQIDAETWAALKAEYPDYIPLNRVMEEVEKGGVGVGGGGFVDQPNPLKKGKGSERDTMETLSTMVERIPQIIVSAKKNAVAQNLYGLIGKYPQEMIDGFGASIVKIKPGDTVPRNVVGVRVEGKVVHMKMDNPALLEGMANLTPKAQNDIVEVVRTATSLMKTLTTGVNPFFSLLRNVFYDTPTAYAYSKTLTKFMGINNPIEFTVDLLDSYVRILTKESGPVFKALHFRDMTKYLQKYRDMGGGIHASASADRNVIAEATARIMPDYINFKETPVLSSGRVVKKGYQGLQRLMSASETGPREPEFMRTLKKKGDTYATRQEGLYESTDITYNYNRNGDVSKFIDAAWPYFGAACQGIDKFSRVLRERPLSLLANTVVAVTSLDMGLYFLHQDDPDYQRLSEATKARYFALWKKKDGTFVKIVKPREIGMLGTMMIDGLEYLKTKDPKAFEATKIGFKNSFLPSSRSIAAPITDLRANKDFADRAIVPAYMSDQSPGTQADINTSKPAIWLGGKINFSPKQIDYLISSYTGILGQIGLPATSEGGNVKEVISRQLTVDPAYSNDTVTRFYAAKDKIDRASSDAKLNSAGLTGDDEKLRKLYSKVSETISDARIQQRGIENNKLLDADAKKAQSRGIQMAIVQMSEVASKPLAEQMAMYNSLKSKGYIEEIKPQTSAQKATSAKTADTKFKSLSKMFTQ